MSSTYGIEMTFTEHSTKQQQSIYTQYLFLILSGIDIITLMLLFASHMCSLILETEYFSYSFLN